MEDKGSVPSTKMHGAGRSSFELIDGQLLFAALGLTPSSVVVDLGCGRGDYTIQMAERIGQGGKVFAIDAWQEGLDELKARAVSRGLSNLEALRADLNEAIPLADGVADLCVMATVLHDILREGTGTVALRETARILKPGGRLAIVEFKKVEDGPGPPVAVRLTPEEVSKALLPFGFRTGRSVEIGRYLYLVVAEREEGKALQ